MKLSWPRMVALAALPMMTLLLSGCVLDLNPQLRKAAIEQGVANAGVTMPGYPARLAAATPHAAVHLGDEPVSVLKRERAQLDKANADKAAAARFYSRVAAGLARPAR